MKLSPVEAMLFAILLKDGTLLCRMPAAIRTAMEAALPLLPAKGPELRALFEDACKRYRLHEVEEKLALLTREEMFRPLEGEADERETQLQQRRVQLLQEKRRILGGEA